MKKSIQVRVVGRVQNVGFRYYTRKTATELSIEGFVKNQSDGSVYIEAEGEPDLLAEFVAWCHRGPAWAHVENIEITEQPFQDYRGFVVR